MNKPINLKDLFNKYGKLFVEELKNTITRQTGIDGNGFAPSKGSVKGGKVVNDKGEHTRLNVTGKFLNNAFKYEFSDTQLDVYINDVKYNAGVSYSDIMYYNNVSQLIFPTNDAELEKTHTLKDMNTEMETILKDFMSQYDMTIHTNINLGNKK